MSQAVFDEVFDVLHRRRLTRFVDTDLRAELLDQLVSGALWFEPTVTVTDCRDAADNKYLELALASRASIIVSGDQDLLVLHPWRGILILRRRRSPLGWCLLISYGCARPTSISKGW
jgi:predicted nucleic acid-binding protein